MRFHVKRPITMRLISEPCPVTGQKNKPRSAGPRGGDPTRKLSGLWRQCPRETQAMRPRQPNRSAGGRPFEARRANALDSARGYVP
jgi:hypothetical protein